MRYRTLTEEQRQEFISTGYVRVPEAFPRSVAQEWASEGYQRLGIDPEDRSTWSVEKIHMPGTKRIDVRDLSPKTWDAVCDLLGGEERVDPGFNTGDSFIVNLQKGADEPFMEPGPDCPGWHKDGDFFRHFLDSPEQGLLVFVLWTDMIERGGATFVSTDSVGPVARKLLDNPQGLLPNELGTKELIHECKEFVQMTGKAGDVVLLHPYTLHAQSQNVLRVPRIITNPPVKLKEPMRFDRPEDELSLVERSTLHALGMESLDFRITGERETFVPDRVKKQKAQMQALTGRDA